jgi:hypothetical protein
MLLFHGQKDPCKIGGMYIETLTRPRHNSRLLRLLISHDGKGFKLGLPSHGHGKLVSIRVVIIAQYSASIVFARVQYCATALLLPMYRRPSWNGGQFGSRSHRGRLGRDRGRLSSPQCRKRMRSISGTRSNRSNNSCHCHPNERT